MALQDREDYDELVHGSRPAWLAEIRGYRAEQELIAAFKHQRELETSIAGEWLDDVTYEFSDGELVEFADVEAAEEWAFANDVPLYDPE